MYQQLACSKSFTTDLCLLECDQKYERVSNQADIVLIVNASWRVNSK